MWLPFLLEVGTGEGAGYEEVTHLGCSPFTVLSTARKIGDCGVEGGVRMY